MGSLIGKTIVFYNAYTGVETYGRIKRASGNDLNVSVITKEEAGPNPRRVKVTPDARIAKIADGTGLIN